MIDSPLLLLLVLAAIAAIPLALRRHRAAQPDGVRVLSRTALSKSTVVAVLAVGDRRLLIGAADQGVRLLADITTGTVGSGDEEHTVTTTAVDADTSASVLGRRDATGIPTGTSALDEDAFAALLDQASPDPSDAGPRIGLVDRLRAMTVRTPSQGRPFHVPLRR